MLLVGFSILKSRDASIIYYMTWLSAQGKLAYCISRFEPYVCQDTNSRGCRLPDEAIYTSLLSYRAQLKFTSSFYSRKAGFCVPLSARRGLAGGARSTTARLCTRQFDFTYLPCPLSISRTSYLDVGRRSECEQYRVCMAEKPPL